VQRDIHYFYTVTWAGIRKSWLGSPVRQKFYLPDISTCAYRRSLSHIILIFSLHLDINICQNCVNKDPHTHSWYKFTIYRNKHESGT